MDFDVVVDVIKGAAVDCDDPDAVDAVVAADAVGVVVAAEDVKGFSMVLLLLQFHVLLRIIVLSLLL